MHQKVRIEHACETIVVALPTRSGLHTSRCLKLLSTCCAFDLFFVHAVSFSMSMSRCARASVSVVVHMVSHV